MIDTQFRSGDSSLVADAGVEAVAWEFFRTVMREFTQVYFNAFALGDQWSNTERQRARGLFLGVLILFLDSQAENRSMIQINCLTF